MIREHLLYFDTVEFCCIDEGIIVYPKQTTIVIKTAGTEEYCSITRIFNKVRRTGFRVNKLNICDAVIAVALIPVAYQSKDPNNMGLPHFAKGEVIKGFGRGSKELGCPTANFSKEVVDQLPADIETGVYCGFASVDQGNVYKMVMSIGWNPFYNNTTKSMETHILHKFDSDFYGKELRIVILEFLRPEKNFASLNELITAINSDIQKADTSLEDVRFSDYKNHSFFTS